jgi:hypothetical protein
MLSGLKLDPGTVVKGIILNVTLKPNLQSCQHHTKSNSDQTPSEDESCRWHVRHRALLCSWFLTIPITLSA